MRLHEALSGRFLATPKGKAWRVVLIDEGLSQNRTLYSEKVLRASISLFEGAKAFAYEVVPTQHDHLPDDLRNKVPNGFARNLVGWYKDVRFEEVDGKGALTAEMHVSPDAAWLREKLLDAFEHGKPDLLGLSIDAEGVFSNGILDGKRVRVVERIERVNSVDLVTHPAAGGRLMRLVASAGEVEGMATVKLKELIELIRESFPWWCEGFQLDKFPEDDASASSLAIDLFESNLDKCRASKELEDVVGNDENFLEVARGERALMQILSLIRKGGDASITEATDMIQKWIAVYPKPENKRPQEGAFYSLPGESGIQEASQLGDFLRKAMEDKNVTLAQMASAAGIDEGTVGQILRGDIQSPPPRRLAGFARVLGVSQERLMSLIPREARASENGGAVKPTKETKTETPDADAELAAATESIRESQRVAKESADAATKLLESVKKQERNGALREAIRDVKLPQVSKDRLVESFTDRMDWTDEDLKTAIEGERSYLDKLAEGSGVRGFGPVDSEVTVIKEEMEKKIERLDKTFDSDPDGYTSFLEAMADISGYVDFDRPRACRKLMHVIALALPGNPDTELEDHHQMIRESGALRFRSHVTGSLREAIDTSTFAQAFGDSITRRLMKSYSSPMNNVWRMPVSNIRNLQDFRTARNVRVGGFGDLATVAAGAPYQEFTNPSDFELTYAASKRGGLVVVRWEALLQDDLGEIRRIPMKLGDAAGRTLVKFVLQTLIFDNPTTEEDSVALVNAAHNNITGNALSYDEVRLSRIRMRKQTDPSSTERIVMEPKFIAGGVDLEDTIDEIIGTRVKITANLDSTVPTTISGLTKLIDPHQTSATQWRLIADPARFETVEVGFLGGRQNPELFVQDQQIGSNFTRDEVTTKIRHVYGGRALDFRALDGRIT